MRKITLVLLITIIVILTACKEKPRKIDPAKRITDQLISSWQEVGGMDTIIKFSDDGKIFTVSGEETGTWSVETPNVLVRQTWGIATRDKVHFTSVNDLELTRLETKDSEGNVIDGDMTVTNYRRITD